MAVGDLHSADSTDSSQKNIYEPNKLFDSFGSINPSIYDGAGSPEKGQNIHFGSKKGHAFDKLNWTEIIKKYSKSKNDNGSTNVQVALLSKRISGLTEHLKVNKKDQSTRRGLLKLVGKRKSLLSYLKKKSIKEYQELIKGLGLRK